MFRNPFAPEPANPVDKLIDIVLEEMEQEGPTTEVYTNLLRNLERLNDLKTKRHRNPVSWDTIAIVLGNLFGIVLIVAYEQKHVMSPTGIRQLMRPKGT